MFKLAVLSSTVGLPYGLAMTTLLCWFQCSTKTSMVWKCNSKFCVTHGFTPSVVTNTSKAPLALNLFTTIRTDLVFT